MAPTLTGRVAHYLATRHQISDDLLTMCLPGAAWWETLEALRRRYRDALARDMCRAESEPSGMICELASHGPETPHEAHGSANDIVRW